MPPPAAPRSGPIPKSPAEIDAMAASGAVLARCLDILEAAVAPGVTTRELDEIAEEFIRSARGIPAFKGYHGFPGTICPSVNEEVVHAIPGPYALQGGDIVSIDCGVILDGWVSDSARTIPVGDVGTVAADLMDATRRSLAAGITAAVPGARVGDISAAVQGVVERAGFNVVRTLVGHGIGRTMHEEPQVPNFGTAGTGVLLEEGVVIAIEPMVTQGDPEVVLGGDGWVVATRDNGLAAHFEHTVAVTSSGPRILTRRDG
ncbi:MAG: type I methionyl aminopeptidase [Thermoleophilia bacterium]|nr:type I methionyl aminopeptidase [Thermoleophilia bacterium]